MTDAGLGRVDGVLAASEAAYPLWTALPSSAELLVVGGLSKEIHATATPPLPRPDGRMGSSQHAGGGV